MRVKAHFFLNQQIWFDLCLLISVVCFFDLKEATAQSLNQLPTGQSLSLTIWGAQIANQREDGSSWDLNSLPDSFLRIYIGERLIKESLPIRDELKPMWTLTIGPISEGRFNDGPLSVEILDKDILGEEMIAEFMIQLPTREELAQVLTIEGKQVPTLIYQWTDTTATRLRTTKKPIPIKEKPFLSETPLSLQALQGRQERLKKDQNDELSNFNRAKRRSKATALYRAYLKALFSGDQIQAHRILLKLTQSKYEHTRHGQKARRIILLDGR